MEPDVKEYDYEAAHVLHPTFDELYEKYQNEVFSFSCYLTKDRGDANTRTKSSVSPVILQKTAEMPRTSTRRPGSAS